MSMAPQDLESIQFNIMVAGGLYEQLAIGYTPENGKSGAIKNIMLVSGLCISLLASIFMAYGKVIRIRETIEEQSRK